ncbi:MAG: cytoskeleton protein RodZ [Thermoleophilaceae bacterium]|jgi:cytoskeletal protein RodZ|nr:cytoskeleton protein RodZ [Thermoleophilaceae bacterium]
MRQKIDIAEVESATKIRAKYLRALENEEFGLLPGNTFVKTFMRTYAEYLGLDAQLLIEEYRVDYEPRGEGDLQPMVSRPSRRQQERRRPRAARGPPGPGTAIVVVMVVVVAILAILGLTGGSNNGANKPATATHAKKKKRTHTKHKRAAAPKATSARVHIVPTSATYLCVDRGLGTPVVFKGTTSSSQTFHGKRVRVNIGNASTVRVFNNGKRVALPAGTTVIGYEFTPTRSKRLAAGVRRPCA